jgi:hypothetical protein
MQIDYAAPQYVRDVVASLGRTEDVKFSPSNRRLAIAEFIKNKIAVFEVSVAASRNSKSIALTSVAEISSTYLNYPHGLDFIDDEKILVVNREGQACIFELPTGAMGNYELAPLAVIRSDDIITPGSVAVIRKEKGFCEALICNNYVHTVTRHRLDLGAGCSIKNSEVLLKKWLDIPDSICVSKETQWIAVSNHGTHAVLLFENNPLLKGSSDPAGILLRTNYPHGLRFTSDGRFILVADAGSPYVNIYETDDSNWRGVRDPLLSFRVLNDEAFLRGRHSREEGGPKGIDINNAMNIFVTTCESQPLAFFDLAAILEDACSGDRVSGSSDVGEGVAHSSNYFLSQSWVLNQKTLQLNYELYRRRIAAAITAPSIAAFRWVLRAFRSILRRARALLNGKLVAKSF